MKLLFLIEASEGLVASDVVIFFGLLMLSAFYSGSESALTAVNPLRVATLAKEGSRSARVVERLLLDRSRLISALLIANNVINVAIATFATVVFSGALLPFVSGDPALAATLAGVVSVTFLLIFGEVVPKTIGLNMPLMVSRLVAWPVHFTLRLVIPLTYCLSWVQSGVLKLLGHQEGSEDAVTSADIKTLVQMARSQDVIGHTSSDAMARLVTLHELSVREVMTPRIDVVGVPESATYSQVIQAFRTHRFSRLPVYEGDIDNIRGLLTIRDLLGMTPSEQENFSVAELRRDAIFVPEQMPVEKLIALMRKARVHLAIVVDEFGGTAGVVSLEDLLEEVVGQIEDEFDIEPPEIRHVTASVVLVAGLCQLSDFEKELKVDLGDTDGIDTVAGLFLREFGKIPTEGDSVAFQGLEFTVRRMKGQRITRLVARLPWSSSRQASVRRVGHA